MRKVQNPLLACSSSFWPAAMLRLVCMWHQPTRYGGAALGQRTVLRP